MKNSYYLFIFFCILLACSKNQVNTTDTNPSNPVIVTGPDIYISGKEYNKTTGNYVAKYWKNGIAVTLTDSSKQAEATSITVVGSDVYVSGYENGVAKYWKNGIAVALTDGSKYAQANCIVVSANDIYVAGYDGQIAKYWKNNTATSFSSGFISSSNVTSFRSRAYAIVVVGNDIYIAGSVGLDTIYTHVGVIPTQRGFDYGAYWKNGILTKTDSIGSSEFKTIAVVGSDIYLGGAHIVTPSNNKYGLYWRNGNWINNTDSTYSNASIFGMCISGTDVYVSGSYGNKAYYWKNGNPVLLSNPLYTGEAKGIALSGNDVYVAGSENSTIKYWKNGTAVSITNGSTNANATGIFVK